MTIAMSEPTRVRKRRRVNGTEGTAVRSITKKQSGEVVSESSDVTRFASVDEPAPAYVTISGKLTKNLGNYESVQIGVSVTLPCPPTSKDVHAIRERASKMVEEFVDMELQNLDSE